MARIYGLIRGREKRKESTQRFGHGYTDGCRKEGKEEKLTGIMARIYGLIRGRERKKKKREKGKRGKE